MVIVIGNTNSGKSTFIKRIKKRSNLKIFSVDDYRLKFSDGSIKGEIDSLNTFLSDLVISLNMNERVIVEIGGIGPLADKLLYIINHKKIPTFIFYLVTDEKILKRRIENEKKLTPVPIAYLTIEKYLQIYLNCEKAGVIYKTWGQLKNSVFLKINNLNHKHMSIVENLIEDF